MKWLSRINVSAKLIGGFLIVSTIGGIVSVQGILKAAQMNDMANVMYERETIGLRHAAEASIQLLSAARDLRNAALAFNTDDRGEDTDNVARRLEQAKKQLDSAEHGFTTAADKDLVAQTRIALQDYEESIAETTDLLRHEALGQSRDSTVQMFSVSKPLADKVENLITQLIDRKAANAAALNDETGRIFSSIQLILISLTAGSVLAGIAIGVLLSRSLTRQLGGEPSYVAQIAEHIAEGDLSVAIETKGQDAASLVSTMRHMRDGLVNVVSQVRAGTLAITSSSDQIASGNRDLSSRTEQQAASLEETAASMEEFTATVRQNADSAQQANLLALTASDIAVKGGAVVSEVIETMGSIEGSSKKIVEIIGVIDGIAFQTNILALNAAVEAARAGDQGRGFAVVASEVRSLAQRSAGAAKEIKTLINDSVQKTASGARLVDTAGATMSEIVDSIKRVTDIMSEIAAASQEQIHGIEQVNQAINLMDGATQQNAAQAEQTSSASIAMSEQVDKLVQTVSLFRLVEEPEDAHTPTMLRPALASLAAPAHKHLLAGPHQA